MDDQALIDAVLADEVDAAAVAQLEARLLGDAGLRRRYAAAARERALLRAAIAARLAGGRTAAPRAVRRASRGTRRLPLALAAALLAALAWWLVAALSESPPALRIAVAGSGSALVEDAGERAASAGTAVGVGARLRGPLVLQAGDGSRFDLAAGARLRVERITDGFGLALDGGALDLQVAAQTAGRQVAVRTAHAEVVVIGTRFTVAASAEATLVEVAVGTVAIADGRGGQRRVAGGERAVATAGGLAERVLRVEPPAPGAVSTLQRTIDGARPGDLVLLAPGRHPAEPGLDHALRIAVAGRADARITIAGDPAGGAVLTSATWAGLLLTDGARHVRVLGLAIAADPAMAADVVGNGISLRGAQAVEIRGCTIDGFPGDGIAAIGCDGLALVGNRINGCSLRSPWGQGGISVKSSLAAGQPALGILVADNRIEGCRDTLPNRHACGIEYTGGNGIGIWEHAAQAEPAYPGYAGAIVLRGNACHGNDGAGVRIHASPGVRLEGNDLAGNGRGPGRAAAIEGGADAVLVGNRTGP